MSLPSRFIYSDLMASASDGSMRAHVDVDAGALMGMPAEASLLTWNPQDCPSAWLPICAYNYSVFYSEPTWSEQTLRDWIEGNWKFIRQKGTPPAFTTALAPSGMRVADMVRPPQGMFLTETLSKEDMDEWTRLAPRIRVTYGQRTGGPDWSMFVGDFLTSAEEYDGLAVAWISANDGPVLIGRYAEIIRDGVAAPLAASVVTNTFEAEAYEINVSYSTQGRNDWGVFVGDYYMGEDMRCFIGADQDEPLFISAKLDQSYVHQTSDYHLEFLQTGLQPASVNYETESAIGDAGAAMFVGGFIGDGFLTANDAPYLIADVYYLYDPAIVLHTGSFGSFIGDRLDIGLRTMEIMVDLNMTAAPLEGFIEDCFIGEFFVTPVDMEPFDRALRAIEAARGNLDRVLVAFDHMRPIEARDIVSEATEAGAYVPNTL